MIFAWFSIDFFTIWWIVMELIKQKRGIFFCWSFGFVFGNNTTRENSSGPHAFYKEILVFFFRLIWFKLFVVASEFRLEYYPTIRSSLFCIAVGIFISQSWWEIWFLDFELKLVCWKFSNRYFRWTFTIVSCAFLYFFDTFYLNFNIQQWNHIGIEMVNPAIQIK